LYSCVLIDIGYTKNIMTKEQKLLLLFVLIIVGGGGAFYFLKGNAPAAQVETTPTTQTTNTVPTAPVATQPAPSVPAPTTPAATATPTTPAPVPTPAPVVQNKTITQKLTYNVPDDQKEDIIVTAVVSPAGTLLSAKFSYGPPTNPQSQQYLQNFSRAFSAKSLIGKKVGTVKLSRLGGASLTTNAFNKVIDTIATKI
jgi:hypothetical protein